METGDKNRDDFHCMEMSLVMSMWYILGDDWNNAQCLSRLSAFLPCKNQTLSFALKQVTFHANDGHPTPIFGKISVRKTI